MKILEYELKLLKDREIEEKAKLSNMDKFFSDGVPINNNILALKSMFQRTREDGSENIKDLETQAIRLTIENEKAQVDNKQIKEDIDQMSEDLDMMEK